MKTSVLGRNFSWFFRLVLLTFVSFSSFLGCSKDDDEKPNPVITSYDLPPEIQEIIFSGEQPKEIRQVEKFLNRIKEKGMAIHEGTNPPEVYNPGVTNNQGVKFNIKNDCIYDEKASINKGTVYGKYEESIRIFKNAQNKFVVEASYSSVGDPAFPDYPSGIDRGSGTGFVSGNGNDFTYFYSVENGLFDNISYKALWIISGTVSGPLNAQVLRNVTKCLVMKEKGIDPDDKIANPGTVRIFKDETPEKIQPEVVLTSLTPNKGVSGTQVTITGAGFSLNAGENIVRFGTATVSATVLSATQLRVVAPAGPTLGGAVMVTVQVGVKSSNALPFTYPQPDVVLTSLTPNNGVAGTQVTITGAGFSLNAGENIVRFGAATVSATVLSATQLRVVAPNQAGLPIGGNVQVTVQVGTKTSNGLPYTYPQPDVLITNLNPGSGPGGTTVVITGSGFSPTAGENIVRFGAATVSATVLSATELRVVAPTGPQLGGVVPVTVQVKSKTSNSVGFTYPQPDISIKDFNPSEGCIGAVITISGSGFSPILSENIIKFNNTTATVRSATPTQLIVIVPSVANVSGNLPVKIPISIQVRSKSVTINGFLYWGFCVG